MYTKERNNKINMYFFPFMACSICCLVCYIVGDKVVASLMGTCSLILSTMGSQQ